jgi:ribulose-5-phosphate 4-epimerase/fuculose-1-phosphate aldolase
LTRSRAYRRVQYGSRHNQPSAEDTATSERDHSAPSDGADLLNVVAALATLRHLDVRGWGSIRRDDGSLLVTPRPGPDVPPPGQLTPDDLVVLDADGSVVGGRWQAPLDVAIDVELYRRRPDARAIVHAQPELALSFAAAGRALEPLTHTESILLTPALPVVDGGALATTPAAARALADAVADRPVALVRGLGSIAVAASPAEAGMLTHQVELLARVNRIAVTLPATGLSRRSVSEADSARISAQKAPPADFQDFFDELAGVRDGGTIPPDPGDGSEEGLRRRVAAACRLLFHHGLVEHLEHVSVRLPAGDAFLITPRKHLGRLRPADIAVVGMDGTWQRGELPPPPFLWLHRDIFEARPDVDAIVHTHQPVARGLVMAGALPRPVDRAGASWLADPAPVYAVPDLMFDPEHRAGALALLGDARVLHEASHGTDYLAQTVEEATVAAILYERQARIWHLASQLGTPAVLPDEVVEAAAAEEPGFMEWWRHLHAELPAVD